MAGFGEMKEKQTTKEQKKVLKDTPASKRTDADPYAALREEYKVLSENRPKTHCFMGIIGHENTGKSAIVLDFYQKYCDKQTKAEKPIKDLWIIDFDGGGAASKSAYYGDNDNIKCWEPWVMLEIDRTAYNYPETHDRVMSIMQYALAEQGNLWGVHITGVDLWDSVAMNCMRIVDLGLSKDGIEAADNRGIGKNERVGHQWDWSIRTTRFHQLTAMSRALVKRGVRIFWETHLKKTNYSGGTNEVGAPWRPVWEKSTNNYLFQIVLCERTDVKDDDGEVIRSDFTATFEKSKTNSKLQGQKSTILITEQGKDPNWMGLPEMERI